MPEVFFAILMERALYAEAVDSLFAVVGECAMMGYAQIHLPYMRTDVARNEVARIFMESTSDPNDTLVMLDCDHVHPQDVVTRLAQRPEGVVGALAFRRGGKHDPLFFIRQPDGTTRQPAEWDAGRVYVCDAVGTGAIAIKRSVFETLIENGFEWPWFRYEYIPNPPYVPTEDIYFARLCEKSGISHHCHTGVEIPHIKLETITSATWARVLRESEEARQNETVEEVSL